MGAWLIGGYCINQLGTILCNHLVVCAKTARRNNNCSRVVRNVQTLRVTRTNTSNFAVLHENFFYFSVANNANAAFLTLLHHALNNELAHRFAGCRTMHALYGRAARHAQLREGDAH